MSDYSFTLHLRVPAFYGDSLYDVDFEVDDIAVYDALVHALLNSHPVCSKIDLVKSSS